MEVCVRVKLTRASLTNSVHGRLQRAHIVKHLGSARRRIDHNCHYYCHGEKLELGCRNASIGVVGGFQSGHGGHNVNAESTRVATLQWDHGGRSPQAELTRAEGRYHRSRNGMESVKLADVASNQDSGRVKNYRGAHQIDEETKVDVTLSQEERSDSFEEGGKATRGSSSSSWARLAGAECPLSTDEEQSLSADVQDLLFLESEKKHLEKTLGREPTVEEWASHCGTSIFKLYARIGKGRAAKRKMIAANLPLVNSVAEQFHGRGLSHWELCQEGVQGLEKSAEKFNTSYNTKFSSYSFLWIWERMSAGVKKFRHVLRISRTVYEMASALLRQKEEFQVLHGRPPSLQELADLSHMDVDKIENVTRLLRPVKSMDESVSSLEGDYEKEFEDQNAGRVPWAHIMESELKAEVAKAFQCLTLREQTVLEMRYGLCGEPPKGRAQVGLALDLTYESIRLMEKKALNKLRNSATEDGLQQYLSGSVWTQ